MDAEVQHLAGGTVGGGSQEGDRLHEEIRRAVELVQLPMDGHVGADDDVRAHRFGDVHGVVVPHAAVQEHLAVLAYCPEIKRDGHRGAQGVGDAARGPVLGRQGVEVRRHAGVRNRKVGEADAVLISYGHRTERVPDIQTVQVAVGQAEAHPVDGLAEHIGRIVAGFLRHPVDDPFVFQAVFQVLVVIVMRDADDICVAILPEFVADILVRDVV